MEEKIMIKKKTITGVIIGVICGLVPVCTENALAQDVIKIAGSSTIRPVVTAASVPFGKANSVTFEIEGGGSSHGVKSVAIGEVDIGDASRHLKDKEKRQWPDLVPHLIGNDGVAIILNKALGITAITKKQVQDIYTGKVRNWKEIGGPDEPIYLVSKEHGRSTLELFLKYSGLEVEERGIHMVHRVKGEKEFSSVKARIIGSNQGAIIQAARKRGSIAYVSVGDALFFAEKTKKIILPSLDGIEATKENISNGTFPITRVLNVVTNGPPNGTVKKFIDYLLSPEGQNFVVAGNFLPVK
jgi:phosphate transport system substrate-binding protein